MNTLYLSIVYCSMWLFYMYLHVGTIAAAENRRIMIPLLTTNYFFNKLLPRLLFLGNIIIGLIMFNWFLAILYALGGIFLFFFTDYWIFQLYFKRKYGSSSVEGEFYCIKLNYKISTIGYIMLIICSIFVLLPLN